MVTSRSGPVRRRRRWRRERRWRRAIATGNGRRAMSLVWFLGKLKERLDWHGERARQSKRQHGGRDEHAVLDGVDRLARHADERGQFGLREVEARALLAQSVDELFRHRGARGSRARRTRATRR